MKEEKRQRKDKNLFKIRIFSALSVFFACSFFIFNFIYAQESVAIERILNFDSEIRVNSDSTINVKETISYDFGDQQKHGIFRDIPIKYKARGGNYNLRISGIKVADENGATQNFTISYFGNDIKIKIGEADKFVNGIKNYVISYVIRRAVNYFPDHDELYWNFTGDKWPVPIENSSVKIILPEKANSDLQAKCYQGVYGTTNECLVSASENTLQYDSKGIISPGEGMTIVAGWPIGIIEKPTFWQNLTDTLKDNWTLFFPIIIFVAMFWIWYRRGRDAQGRGTIIAQYEPPDKLAPAEIGTMIDGSADNQDVSSTIIDLAVNKFLKIKRVEEKGFLGIKSAEYTFTKLKDEEPSREFEKEVMKGIFDPEEADAHGASGGQEAKLADLKNKFYKTLATAKDQLYKGVAEKGYYVSNPKNVKLLWIILAVVAGIILATVLGALQNGYGVFSAIVSAIIIFIFGLLMPKVTLKGAKLKEDILGFKDFLSVTEKDRLKFHNAPEKNPQMFERFLPYAMVLGVEKEWAKQFEGIYNQQPDWYEDSSGRVFNAMILGSMLSDFSSSATSAMASQPSSAAGGGSGFSGGGGGGGFGGGGGGSW